MDFNDIVGHESIINSLKNAISSNKVAHSYLFEGAKSIGKEKLAKTFAKALLCKDGDNKPCEKCSSCIKFESGNHPDFCLENPLGDSFKKEQIESIQKDIKMMPYEGNRKVYILNNIDKMTQEAQNSFLKTLEEPPEYVTIILIVTNSHSILPTILSRCQIIKFAPISNDKVEKALVDIYKIEREEARFLSSFSNGIIGKAINLYQNEGFKKLREEVITVIDTTLSGDKFKIFSLSEFFDENKENIEDILDMMLMWFRDMLIYKEAGNSEYIINMDKIDIISKHCKSLSQEKIHDIIETIIKTKDSISSRVNYQLAIEVMLLSIQEDYISC
ncbi:DNA polymerase III subunit gamma/tau [Gottschalkia purinilytica]|uniref:DNA polymerase III subunit delta' n=1 Tax=Gottschalkia purinilytica TaxID=1503 RepID=A0A0L0WEG2_GOTPU|nr:DNA polymerase III subunit delta' [Gottschalkia purinilytica]KNF09826.1 DNA polymerase III subunit gamma/tau [Gottschalkia purinilytica]